MRVCCAGFENVPRGISHHSRMGSQSTYAYQTYMWWSTFRWHMESKKEEVHTKIKAHICSPEWEAPECFSIRSFWEIHQLKWKLWFWHSLLWSENVSLKYAYIIVQFKVSDGIKVTRSETVSRWTISTHIKSAGGKKHDKIDNRAQHNTLKCIEACSLATPKQTLRIQIQYTPERITHRKKKSTESPTQQALSLSLCLQVNWLAVRTHLHK